MSRLARKNQMLAVAFACTAVFLFAFFESKLGNLVKKISINEYIIYRLLFTCCLYFAILRLITTLKKQSITLVFSPRNVDRILFVRGIVTVFYWACLAAAFANTKSQALTYPFFFLHPLWQIIAIRYHRKIWPPIKKQIAPITLIVSGVILFALFNPENIQVSFDKQKLLQALPSYLPALLAGIGFAYTNELSSDIAAKCKERPYKFMGNLIVEKMDGLRLTAYTTYAALLLLPVWLPVMLITMDSVEMNYSLAMFKTPDALGGHIQTLSIACLIVGFGTWAINEAFARAQQTTQIAALDGLIVPIAAGFDLWHGKLPIDHPNFIWMLGALALIMAGALWSALQPDTE
ncbi:hypothetical protein ACU5P1_04920 [Pseudomonas plecoglossicida]|uniref:Uncharacterized protein n=1 Tax=Pseudomonas plecoglossicida TaxID=70775 RepID=A0AAD0QZR2_PSEDL|nr:hypothetical protein [Pseudomonas plecoglossicida]AXM98050.1 hypothetical protein DVB73_20845 [Pseudomonas plecoglossicida]EPB96020.1 hypothetical protein L321_10029 [Pseudomonas plecoglossicida NB2011]QLB54194.1 hypothetical protein HAV28_04870 [Pseudomonas plecoglossicida]